ncbi:MAG TPA: hypothetical protein VGM44_12910 [Polyangiaceae bacterium]|jgi:hypothetical protein
MRKLFQHLSLTASFGAVVCSFAPAAIAADAPATAAFPQAAPDRNQCLEAHRSAQEFRKSSKLLESQEQLLICSSESCPGAIITDCGKWLTELDQLTPSVVFQVRVDGKETSGAHVELDGREINDWSQAIKVNPGRHDVRVTVEGFDPYTESVVAAEGQRLKMISAEFKKPAQAPQAALVPQPIEHARPTPPGVYALLGVGVVGAASFATFAAIGKTKQNQLDNDCLKVMSCTDSDLKPMKTDYLIGDISAGVGAAALIGAAIVYFTRPTIESSPTSFTVGSVAGSPTSFGVSASRAW